MFEIPTTAFLLTHILAALSYLQCALSRPLKRADMTEASRSAAFKAYNISQIRAAIAKACGNVDRANLAAVSLSFLMTVAQQTLMVLQGVSGTAEPIPTYVERMQRIPDVSAPCCVR